MLFSELMAQTAALGFLPQVGDAVQFAGAANRALMRACSLSPQTKTIRILHLPAENLLGHDGAYVTRAPLVFSARGAASYTFRADGEGILEISRRTETGTETLYLENLQGEALYTGGIEKDATPILPTDEIVMTILPHDTLRVWDVGLYAAPVQASGGRKTADSRETVYDLSVLCPQFAGFIGLHAVRYLPYTASRQTATQSMFAAGTAVPLPSGVHIPARAELALPTDAPGIYEVTCRVVPRPLKGDAAEEVDLSAELLPFLPLLCAAECYYEEDPDKCAFYLSLYEKATAHLAPSAASGRIGTAHPSGW